jgi:hypothetical protein
VDRQFDLDSFLEPLFQDLRILATDGVRAERWVHAGPARHLVDFTLRAHLLTMSGDMPAVSKVRLMMYPVAIWLG